MSVGLRIRNPNGSVRFSSETGWWGLIIYSFTVGAKTVTSSAANLAGGSLVVPNAVGNMSVFTRVTMNRSGNVAALPLQASISGNTVSWYWPSATPNGAQVNCLGAEIFIVTR